MGLLTYQKQAAINKNPFIPEKYDKSLQKLNFYNEMARVSHMDHKSRF